MSKKIFAVIVYCFCITFLAQTNEQSPKEQCDRAVKLMLSDKYDEAEAYYNLAVLHKNRKKIKEAEKYTALFEKAIKAKKSSSPKGKKK